MVEPEIQVPSTISDPRASSRMEEMIKEQPEFFGVSPTELSRAAVSPEIDPRRSPHRAFVFQNGAEPVNPSGTLLPGRID